MPLKYVANRFVIWGFVLYFFQNFYTHFYNQKWYCIIHACYKPNFAVKKKLLFWNKFSESTLLKKRVYTLQNLYQFKFLSAEHYYTFYPSQHSCPIFMDKFQSFIISLIRKALRRQGQCLMLLQSLQRKSMKPQVHSCLLYMHEWGKGTPDVSQRW